MKVGRLIGDTAARLPLIGAAIGRLQVLLRKARAAPSRVKVAARIAVADYLPSRAPGRNLPEALQVAVIIPVYRGLDETLRCLGSVLRGCGGVAAEIIVIDDCSPEPELSRRLEALADAGAITLLRNEVNRGFVHSVNRGMAAAGGRDVILLNSDTEVPAGWIGRLAGHAYSDARIGSVTPFSNHATICSWPSAAGGALPPGKTTDEMDVAFLAANRGRQVDLPTAVGFCMYVRRDCLDQVGGFDEATFGRGYGEENDFCLRATVAGWRHLLACDTFVFHVGETSFGKDSPERARAWDLLVARYPHYPESVARHVQADPAAGARFAATAALYRLAAEPTILVVTHALGGGTERHVREVQAAVGQRANLLRLEPRPGGMVLSLPGLAAHPEAFFAADQLAELVSLLQSFAVDRVHVHHWIGYEASLRELLDRLALPFDFTVHDFYALCPRINLLPSPTSLHCGQPDAATCDACLAASPQVGADSIVAWRERHTWMLREAERAICPSVDTRNRVARHMPHAPLMVVPHEPVTEKSWHVKAGVPAPGEPLRIGLIGAIAPHKGLLALADAFEAADPREFEFVVIGECGPEVPRRRLSRARVTGRYEEADLPRLIAEARLHVAWFPATWPETYSYTLSMAIAASLPIIAPAIGAFPERLHGRPLTWIIKPGSDWCEVRATLEECRSALIAQAGEASAPRRTAPEVFYPDAYLRPLAGPRQSKKAGRI
jgi:GT2 family glycosyltransferase/glycosyltransferase involved in cell wall biosynthesis